MTVKNVFTDVHYIRVSISSSIPCVPPEASGDSIRSRSFDRDLYEVRKEKIVPRSEAVSISSTLTDPCSHETHARPT